MEAILEVIFGVHGHVFGGYVRDMIWGSHPHDIDCYIPPEAKMEFLRGLVKISSGGVIIKEMNNYSDHYYEVHSFMRLLVRDAYQCRDIQVDVCGDPLFCPDFDVNMLKLGRHGISCFDLSYRLGYSVDLPKIFEHIKQRQAQPFVTAKAWRRQKMLDKGWTIIGEERRDEPKVEGHPYRGAVFSF